MNTVHPMFLQTTLLVIACSLEETLSLTEQAFVGSFLSALGDLLSFNSSYMAYMQDCSSETDGTQKNRYEIMKKSIQKIEEEIEKMKQTEKNF